MLLTEQQIADRINYNKNLLTIPDSIAKGNLTPTSEDVVVRLIMYEVEMNVDPVTGMIEPLYKIHQSDGGREVARLDTPKYSTRAVIVKLSDKAMKEGFAIGHVVWLPIHVCESTAYRLFTSRENPVLQDEGYLKVPFRLIEFIEKDLYANG